MKQRNAVLLFVVCLSAVVLQAQSSAESLFNSKCAKCHGTDGKGKGATASKMHPPDLGSKDVQQLSDDAMYETIAKGTQHKEYPHAYEYQGMNQQQIRGLVAHIRTLKK
jgi:mono/diheme cytochrome c family protein